MTIALIIVIIALLAVLAYREWSWREREAELVDCLETVEARCDGLQDQNEKLEEEVEVAHNRWQGYVSIVNRNEETILGLRTNLIAHKDFIKKLQIELSRALANLEMVINQYNPITLTKEDHEDYYARTRCRYSARRPARDRSVRTLVRRESSDRLDALFYTVYAYSGLGRDHHRLSSVDGGGL